MSELFHYTNVDGLEGILKSQNLWATHFRFLNDPTELTFVARFVERIFEAEVFDLIANDDARFGSVVKLLRDAFAKDEAAQLFRSAFTTIDRTAPIFICSLCRHDDESIKKRGLLSQWRGYGFGGG